MRKLLAPIAAASLIAATAGIALAWSAPTLTANCAPDENTFAWTINLPGVEDNYKVDLSWDNFATPPFDTIDFGTGGDHDFTTPRGGSILYVRWTDDPDKMASVSGDTELCVPVESNSPEQSVAQSVAQSAEQSVEAGTGTPAGSVPNSALGSDGPSPLPTILFSMALLASLGTLAYANVKVAARRNR